MLFRITAASPEYQLLRAFGEWTVEAETGEQALSRLFSATSPPSDLWPLDSKWTVQAAERSSKSGQRECQAGDRRQSRNARDAAPGRHSTEDGGTSQPAR